VVIEYIIIVIIIIIIIIIIMTPTGSTSTHIKYIQNAQSRKKALKLDIHENTNTIAIKGNRNKAYKHQQFVYKPY